MFKNTTCTLKNILKIFVFVGIVFVFVILLSKTADSQLIKRVKDFTKDGTKVLYITNQDSYKKFPIDILRKYDSSLAGRDIKDISPQELKESLKKVIYIQKEKHRNGCLIMNHFNLIIQKMIHSLV